MANTIAPYNPIFYAQEALKILKNTLGMAARVHLGYDAERGTFGKGDTIQIRKPGSFTAQNAGGNAQDLAPTSTTITLDQHKEVRFEVTDKQLAYTTEAIIEEHIEPAAYALADHVDSVLNGLYLYVPWHYEQAAADIAVKDVTQTKAVLFNNGVPMKNPALMHCEVDGINQAGLETLPAFSQWQGAAAKGVALQQGGMSAMGPKYGVNFFADQNAPTHTAGSITASAPKVKTEVAVGGTSVTVYDTTLTGDVHAGDTFSLAGHTQRYAITAQADAGSNEVVCAISPPAKATMAADTAVTFRQQDNYGNLMFHRNWAALAMAKLPEAIVRQGGASVKTIQDESGIAIRSLMQYDIGALKSVIVLDILYGVKVLDPNMCCILQRKTSY